MIIPSHTELLDRAGRTLGLADGFPREVLGRSSTRYDIVMRLVGSPSELRVGQRYTLRSMIAPARSRDVIVRQVQASTEPGRCTILASPVWLGWAKVSRVPTGVIPQPPPQRVVAQQPQLVGAAHQAL